MIPARVVIAESSAGKPRASGDDPSRLTLSLPVKEVNPARAGMIRILPPCSLDILGKPRASGDDPMSINVTTGPVT